MHATTEDIKELVFGHPDTLLVVDCYAQWCGPCKRIAPEVEQLEQQYHNKIIVRKIDVDKNPDFVEMFEIGGMPTFLFFKNRTAFFKVVGANMEAVHQAIQKYL